MFVLVGTSSNGIMLMFAITGILFVISSVLLFFKMIALRLTPIKIVETPTPVLPYSDDSRDNTLNNSKHPMNNSIIFMDT